MLHWLHLKPNASDLIILCGNKQKLLKNLREKYNFFFFFVKLKLPFIKSQQFYEFCGIELLKCVLIVLNIRMVVQHFVRIISVDINYGTYLHSNSTLLLL